MPGDERELRRTRQDLILSGQNIFINQPRQVICLVNIVAECAIAGLIASQCYGAGNMPSNRDDLLESVTEAATFGMVVTQCERVEYHKQIAWKYKHENLVGAPILCGLHDNLMTHHCYSFN